MTSAPRLHRSCVQNGPGRRRVKSRTVMPSRAAGTAAASRGRGINLRARRIFPAPSCDAYGTCGGGGAGDWLKSKQSDISSALASRWFNVERPKFTSQNFNRLTCEWKTLETYPLLAYGLNTMHPTRGPYRN